LRRRRTIDGEPIADSVPLKLIDWTISWHLSKRIEVAGLGTIFGDRV
jgi:hypothetical protein